jgi:hypothetical protein
MANPQKGLLSRRQYLLDLSMVTMLDAFNNDLPKNSLLVPDTLDKLLRSEQPTPKLAEVLTKATMPTDPTELERQELTITVERLSTAMKAYRRLVGLGVIRTIRDEQVSEPELTLLLELLASSVPNDPEVVLRDGTRLTPLKLVRKHVGVVLNYSKRTRTAILSRGRSLASHLIGRIDVLHLLDKSDKVWNDKSAFVDKWLKKVKGGKTAKVAAGWGITIAGVFTANPFVTGAGIGIAILDP